MLDGRKELLRPALLADLISRNGESDAAHSTSQQTQRKQRSPSSQMAGIAGAYDVFVCLGDDHCRLLARTPGSLSPGICCWGSVHKCGVSADCCTSSKAVCLCCRAPGKWHRP